ncbi:MAG: bifunctional adenosylcobinamide kinase/adenosylcobinamide-phosphate guanylyltransferase [Firmicutes bacterium]|nr:bifunctional adenosylcobinamide kinase/adenosylcobinamide-phosphate guanylyltransferase [Bacillota bacterium]
MIVIFGGAYQGKLDYARENFNICIDDVFMCQDNSTEIDITKKVICGLENFTFACVKAGLEARDLLADLGDMLSDKIIIVSDISQGIVPLDADQRAWREMNGRCMLWLGKEADRVIRVFCGLGQDIK